MSLLKFLANAFATPLAIALLIAIFALVCRVLGRTRLATWLFATAGAFAYLCSTGPVGNALLGPLERQYPALLDTTSVTARYVVVLGSAYYPRPDVSAASALDEDGLARIVEGVRLARAMDAKGLIVCGGSPKGRPPTAEGYARLAKELGISDEALILIDHPLDTAEEARAIRALLGEAPFVLVTSAYHLPRAMKLMAQVDARAIPAAAGHRARGGSPPTWRDVLPGSNGLRRSERAIHEYLGLLALSIGAVHGDASATRTVQP